jgi:N6-adenosine-specific RNA methylase IME4
VVEEWGFEYKTVLTWVKDQFFPSNWLRSQTEYCLLAIRGRPVHRLTNEATVLYGPRRSHSEKPDEFYELVERLCPGSKVELFSRNPRPGWTVHGDEIAPKEAV